MTSLCQWVYLIPQGRPLTVERGWRGCGCSGNPRCGRWMRCGRWIRCSRWVRRGCWQRDRGIGWGWCESRKRCSRRLRCPGWNWRPGLGVGTGGRRTGYRTGGGSCRRVRLVAAGHGPDGYGQQDNHEGNAGEMGKHRQVSHLENSLRAWDEDPFDHATYGPRPPK